MNKRHRLFFIALLLFGAVSSSAQIEIDSYGALTPDDEFARLHYFADILKASPNAKGSVIIYKDKDETTGSFLRYFYGVKAFLTSTFGVSLTKVNVAYGGEEMRKTELYSGSDNKANKLRDGKLEETLQRKITKKTLFDTACIDCDSSPFINQFIFREGIDYLAKALKANPETYSIIEIARVEYLSKNTNERAKLSNEIYKRLEQNGLLSRRRVRLRFVKGSFARIYIIPNRSTPRHDIKQT